MLPGIATVLPRMVSLATDRNRRGRSASLGVRPLIQDQLYPCRPPEKAKWMRSASVFAGQMRTNQPSCAAAAGIPISSTIRAARKNGRIYSPMLLSHTDYRPQTSRSRQLDHHQDVYTTRKMAGLIQIKARRDGADTVIARSAGDE